MLLSELRKMSPRAFEMSMMPSVPCRLLGRVARRRPIGAQPRQSMTHIEPSYRALLGDETDFAAWYETPGELAKQIQNRNTRRFQRGDKSFFIKCHAGVGWGEIFGYLGRNGSGKTTTLYSAMAELNQEAVNLSTAEDPVEFNLKGINQVQMHEDIGLNFAAALRSFLRQDPDIIMVGEIRDFETAEIAVKAALTGHLVLSTLHTNDAPGAIPRLMDMGIPPFLITATVEAILAQRLVRRICSECREQTRPTTETLADMGLTPDEVADKKFYRGAGCETCNNTGFKGRVGLFELMVINDDLRDMIMENRSTEDLREAARHFGMVSLRDAGMDAVYEGTTTLDEIVRETVLDA